MSSVTLRRCSGSSKSKSLYDTIVEEAEAQRDSHLASRMRRRRLQRANWDVVESILCDKGEGDITDRIIMLARLHPTFKALMSLQIQYGNSNSAIVQAPRRRITKIEDDDAEAPSDVSMEDSSSAVRGPFYALERSQLRQHDYRNSDGTLISPLEINSVLTPGTLVLVMLKFILYVMRDQKTEKGEPKPNKKASWVIIFSWTSFESLTAVTVNRSSQRSQLFLPSGIIIFLLPHPPRGRVMTRRMPPYG
ncbi:hypothetical protein B0H13DRAFT_1873581 [Mycena leptocephala]|nr:hypothetical protein B0H13DRAFT_1873581 [Mycena leptocephala]